MPFCKWSIMKINEYHLAIGKDDMEDNTDPDHTDTRF
jgi:hypothetical protein